MRALRRGILAAAIALGMITVPVPSRAQQMTKDQLIGTWQLVSFKATTGNQVSHPLGEHPSGYAVYTQARVSLVFIDSARQAPAAAAPTDAEAASLMRSHVAYTGKYDADPVQTADGIKITIHVDVASNQALAGTSRAFFMRVDGNK